MSPGTTLDVQSDSSGLSTETYLYFSEKPLKYEHIYWINATAYLLMKDCIYHFELLLKIIASTKGNICAMAHGSSCHQFLTFEG